MESSMGPATDRWARLALARPTARSEARVEVTDKWEGRVLDVGDDYIVVSLRSLDRPGPELEVEFDIEDLEPEDRPLVAEGAWLYVYSGLLRNSPVHRVRTTSVRFKRLPRWTQEELEAAMLQGKELMDALGAVDEAE